MAMVTLYYKQEPVYDVSALNSKQLQITADDSVTLSILQGECPDFSVIMKYLNEQTFSEDKKLHDVIGGCFPIEAKHWSVAVVTELSYTISVLFDIKSVSFHHQPRVLWKKKLHVVFSAWTFISPQLTDVSMHYNIFFFNF